MKADDGRTRAEWVTLGASCTVLAVVIALIALQFRNSNDAAMPVAIAADEVRSSGGQYFVDVVVTNEGDETAANVHVSASLEVDGTTTEGDQTIDFLARKEEERLTFVFDVDPARGELTIAVTGFAQP